MNFDRADLVALVGLGLLTWGLYLVYPPLAPIVGGLILIAAGTAMAGTSRRRR